MPVIACPGCGKQYKVADSAAGQVAKCACGKRFRLGSSPVAASSPGPSKSPAAAPTAPAKTVAAPPQTKRAPAKAAAPVSDDFWDDALAIADAPKQAPAAAAAATSPSTARSLSSSPAGAAPKSKSTDKPKKKKRKKESGGVRWGFDWGKVVGGLGTFLIFGGITAGIAMTTGRISLYLAALAIVGLFTMLNGLMGEEGIW